MNIETVVFNGRTYRRYPNSKHRHLRMYFQSGWKYKKSPLLLHREVWKAAHGEIPDGCEIHHKDGNTLNNAPDNLECLTPEEHRRLHVEGGSYACTEGQRQHLERVRPLTLPWHKTEEGKALHSGNGRKTWENRRSAVLSCQQCGAAFSSTGMRTKFCSQACFQKWHRAHKTYHEDRACAECGRTFSVNKYKKNVCCSSACSKKHNAKTL